MNSNGKARANFLVTVGLGLNVLILFILFLGNSMPSVPAEAMPPWQVIQLAAPVALPNGDIVESSIGLYQLIYATTSGAVFASMLAYIAAQYCDVQLFHFWKRVTRGKHLWIRNNFSTLMSQMVDSVTVVSVTFGAAFLRGDIAIKAMLILIGSNYLFKAAVALLDTGPLYLAVHYLRRYMHLDEGEYAIAEAARASPRLPAAERAGAPPHRAVPARGLPQSPVWAVAACPRAPGPSAGDRQSRQCEASAASDLRRFSGNERR